MATVFNMEIEPYVATLIKKFGVTPEELDSLWNPVPVVSWIPGTMNIENLTLGPLALYQTRNIGNATTTIDVFFIFNKKKYKFKKGVTVRVHQPMEFNQESRIVFNPDDIEPVASGGRRKKSMKRRKHSRRKSSRSHKK